MADTSTDKDTDIANDYIIVIKSDMADMHKKVAKIKNLVNKLVENCNIYDKQSQIVDESTLNELVDQFEDDMQYLSTNGHSQLNNDKLIQEFFNYCVNKCIKEERLEFMIVVAVSLPYLVTKCYKSTVSNLMMQISYVKIPSKWCKDINRCSIRENLWGYKFHDNESPLTRLDKFETIPPHSATLCYVPLPGLCTYPDHSDVFNNLFPYHLSPFAKLVISNSSDVLDTSQASSVIYESVSIQAIIKFKWHAFARWRFFVMFFAYLTHFTCYSMAMFKSNKTTEGRGLMILSIILQAIFIFQIIRYAIICILIRNYNIGIIFIYRLLALVLSTIAAFLYLYNDMPTPSSVYIQSISVFLLWISIIGCLCVFKNIGISSLHICRKMLWPLLFLLAFISAFAHSAAIYLAPKVTGVNKEHNYDDREIVAEFYNSLTNVWDAFQNDYNLFLSILKIFFSLFTSIIILNLLISLVNHVYEEVLQRAHAEWTIVLAKFIVFIELLFMFPWERQKGDYFPSTITYEAFTEEVNEWPNKLKERKMPIPWEDDSTDK